MSRIGIFGGSFNPPHAGHVQLVRSAMEGLALDRVLVIPAATPPHKQMPAGSPDAEARLEMTRLAMAELPAVQVLDLELRRPGKSYTSDTLRELRAQYPEDQLVLLMGTDMFLSLPTWHEPEVICALADPVVHSRAVQDDRQALLEQAALLAERYGCRPVVLDNVVVEISSTTVRRMIALQAAEGLLPRVWDYVREQGLYDSGRTLKNLHFEALKQEALALYDEKRVPHALGCLQTAQALAERFGADAEAAARAAILHDVTKALRRPEQLQLCQTYGIVCGTDEMANSSLLHSITGAGAAARVFGEAPEICDAIRWHTTGRPHMTILEKIIYLADYIEPNRSFPGLDDVRKAAETDLDQAVLLAMEGSLQDLARRGITASPQTRLALEALRSERTRE